MITQRLNEPDDRSCLLHPSSEHRHPGRLSGVSIIREVFGCRDDWDGIDNRRVDDSKRLDTLDIFFILFFDISHYLLCGVWLGGKGKKKKRLAADNYNPSSCELAFFSPSFSFLFEFLTNHLCIKQAKIYSSIALGI